MSAPSSSTHPAVGGGALPVPGGVLWRRLDLVGDREYLRWLHGHAAGRGLVAVAGGPSALAGEAYASAAGCCTRPIVEVTDRR